MKLSDALKIPNGAKLMVNTLVVTVTGGLTYVNGEPLFATDYGDFAVSLCSLPDVGKALCREPKKPTT